MSFRVDEDTDPERVAVAAKGAMLTYAPADGEEFADELTDDDLPAGLWPLRWTASDVAALDLD